MAAEDGNRPLPPDVLHRFNYDFAVQDPPEPRPPVNNSGGECESPEVTIRQDHHLPTETDHERLLHDLTDLGCTQETIDILAACDCTLDLWHQMLRDRDSDRTMTESLKIDCGILRAKIRVFYRPRQIVHSTNGHDHDDFENLTRSPSRRTEPPKIPIEGTKPLCSKSCWLEYRLGITGWLELVKAPQLCQLSDFFMKRPLLFKQSYQTIQLTEGMETHIDAEWANHIMTNANRHMRRML